MGAYNSKIWNANAILTTIKILASTTNVLLLLIGVRPVSPIPYRQGKGKTNPSLRWLELNPCHKSQREAFNH